MLYRRIRVGNLPGGPVVKNLPSNPRDIDLILGQGMKIPHAAGQERWPRLLQQRPSAAPKKVKFKKINIKKKRTRIIFTGLTTCMSMA